MIFEIIFRENYFECKVVQEYPCIESKGNALYVIDGSITKGKVQFKENCFNIKRLAELILIEYENYLISVKNGEPINKYVTSMNKDVSCIKDFDFSCILLDNHKDGVFTKAEFIYEFSDYIYLCSDTRLHNYPLNEKGKTTFLFKNILLETLLEHLIKRHQKDYWNTAELHLKNYTDGSAIWRLFVAIFQDQECRIWASGCSKKDGIQPNLENCITAIANRFPSELADVIEELFEQYTEYKSNIAWNNLKKIYLVMGGFEPAQLMKNLRNMAKRKGLTK